MALANSVGRYITAAGPLIAGVIAVSWFGGDLGMATTCVAAFGLIALIGLAFAPETRGAALPTDPTDPISPRPPLRTRHPRPGRPPQPRRATHEHPARQH